MKETLLFILLSFCATIYIQAQLVEKNDTLYLNYLITPGEFGGCNEGIIIYHDKNDFKAISVSGYFGLS